MEGSASLEAQLTLEFAESAPAAVGEWAEQVVVAVAADVGQADKTAGEWDREIAGVADVVAVGVVAVAAAVSVAAEDVEDAAAVGAAAASS